MNTPIQSRTIIDSVVKGWIVFAADFDNRLIGPVMYCQTDDDLVREVILRAATQPATMLTKLGLEPTNAQ